MPRAKGVLADSSDLAAAAQLLHMFCFDRVVLETPQLAYEPRWSCQCTKCAAVWVASKSGDVMRIGLCTPSGRAEQRWFPGNREARTLYHQHDGAALGGGSFLLIGRDDGSLDIIPDEHPEWTDRPPSQHRHGSRGSFHLDSWCERGDQGDIAVSGCVERTPRSTGKYAAGVTAIAVLPRAGSSDTIDILVTTRYPWLYVVEAKRGRMRLRPPIAMPGWIEWIIGPQQGDQHQRLALISRGGELVRFSHDDLLNGRRGETTALSLLPTAAMPFGDDSILLGTTTGPYLVRDGCFEGIAVPVTRSPVLCLDRVELKIDGDTHEYVTMGLDDRRMRVVDAELLRALAHGDRRPPTHNRSFPIEMSDAVLAVEALRLDDGPPDVAYVLAVLRDHAVCLFHVTSPQAQRATVLSNWEAHVLGPPELDAGQQAARAPAAKLTADQLTLHLDAARATAPPDCDSNAWKYMLIDVVLPRLRKQVSAGGDEHRDIVTLACKMAAGADRFVLHRLSVALEELAGNDVGLLLELSRSILAAVPHGNDRRWAAFIDSHLRDLNALVRRCHGGDRARLVAWTRFVRKYVLLGNTFSVKQFGLRELVEQNHEIRKYLDALIYQTRLAQRCYDLRWESRVGDEVAELHTVDCGAGRTIVVVATVDGTLVFLDGTSGRRLGIEHPGVRDVLTPFEGHGPARTLACAVAHDRGQFRVVMSCTGALVPSPGLAVIEGRWSPQDTSIVIIDSVQVMCDGPRARVYALQPLPGKPAFVAGLETPDSPVGLLQKLGRTWKLELTTDNAPIAGPDARPVERPSLAPGKMPTRALGVVACDDAASRYLVVAGSDDGLVRAISFASSEPVSDWRVCRWDRVADAVSSIVLGRHVRPSGAHGVEVDDSLFSCYVGTAAGDTLALSIQARNQSSAGTAFGDYDALPLWREPQDGGILAMRLWRTPLYPPEDASVEPKSTSVLVAVTEKGRLCFYRHSPCSKKEKQRVSAAFNYHFRGMRFDRVTMPDRLCALAMIDQGRGFVAAGPGGRLYMGELRYLRNSIDRIDPELRSLGAEHRDEAAEPRSQATELGSQARRSDDELPDEMWSRLHHLFMASKHEWLGVDAERDAFKLNALKLGLCDLVRVEGAALAGYVLRERLVFQEPWETLSATQLRDKARDLLHPLEPENPEDADRIKVIIKSLCRAYLFFPPGDLRKQILAEPSAAPPRHPETAAACEVVAEYLTRDLVYSTRAAARLRIVAIKELLRVPVLWHMAQEGDYGSRIRVAVESALDSCLRDDDRLVRIETLRALCVALRNVGVMADRDLVAEHDRARLIQGLFPQGLGSVEWLLERVVEGLLQFPNFTRRAALVSGAWHHIKVLLPLFRIFDDHTLALCDYLVRAGLGVEVVAMCCQLLRPQRAAATRIRITNLYLIPVLGPRDARDEYIQRYDKTKPRHQELLKEMKLGPPGLDSVQQWYELDDAAMADRLLQLLDQLARMWSVKKREQIGEVAKPQPATRVRDAHAPLGALEGVVAELASVAANLAKPETEDEGLRHLGDLGSKWTLTVPLRTIVSGIGAAWRDIYAPPFAEPGTQIGRYTLGTRIAEGGFGSLFELDDPPGTAAKHVIKVLRQRNSPSARKRFLEGAYFNKLLCDNPEYKDYIVSVIDIIDEAPHLAYVMPKYHKALKEYLEKGLGDERKLLWMENAAEHVGLALKAAHASHHCHGDVKPANILVTKKKDGFPEFHLGDFDLAYASDDTTETSIKQVRIVPECLKKSDTRDHVKRRQWEDIAALSVILYRMLTGEIVDPDTTDLCKQVERLDEHARDKQIVGRPRALQVVQTLIQVFNKKDAFDIQAFLDSVSPPPRKPRFWQRRPLGNSKMRILFLAANPVTTQKLDLEEETRLVQAQLQMVKHRNRIEFIVQHAVRPDDLVNFVRKAKPTVVHFGGHGSPQGIILRNDHGSDQPVSGDSLRQFFAKRGVQLVVLNACYSEHQERCIVASVCAVVGTTSTVNDEAALRFSVAFYRALGNGLSVGEAFRDGCDSVSLHGLPDVYHSSGDCNISLIS